MHSRVQQLNKISRSDALALGYFQQFNDSAFHNLRLGFRGLSDVIHCHLLSIMHFCEAKRTSIKFSLDRLPLSVQNGTLSLIADLAGWVSRDGNGCRTDCCPMN